jgi:hypothetical protein
MDKLDADTRTPRYMLVRLMIAAQHQNRGFGRAALQLVIEHWEPLAVARTQHPDPSAGKRTSASRTGE